MKEQYSSNYDDPFVANQRLKNKLDFLERESLKRQNYLKQVERNLKLTKQTVKSLQQNNPKKDQLLFELQNQNTSLLEKLKQQFSGICRLNALYLMECQLRIEETKSYNERIRDFEETMAELRRYLHDKEESFSYVAQKLKKFQQLLPNQQLIMYEKLINYSGIVKEEVTWKSIFSEILQDRDQWKKQCEQAKERCKRLQMQVQSIKEYPQFNKFQSFFNNLNEQQATKLCSGMNSNQTGQSKNHSNQSTNMYSERSKLSIQPNIELIRLMKKQKLSNKILEAALTDAIQKNLQLIEYNKRLVDNNQQLRTQTDFIISDMVVLCEVLAKYDLNYKTKLRILKHKSKCDIDIPSYKEILQKYKNNQIEEAQQILFTKMRQDVEEMTEYIALCPLKKTNSIRSYESPRQMYKQTDKLQIQMDEKQLEISQI